MKKKNSFIFNFRGMSPRIDLWKENSNLEKRILFLKRKKRLSEK
ncbi:hypothetical protein LEP1GSC171_0977 [Leptospira santarosai str. HAI1380]|uniref:Uncharacterized protein n=2 Tax=Leptospira santarosai TaxID=28183 RepID=K8XTX3_9LEPT|nr:hypothetical protein LEP1GSC179_1110 [Leptospira santarosai str. MOR084]EKS09706.1 hypothetical protein LEP1GSC071_1294 [Leptospira santarosai str. JET]EKT84909.1 hypothetical protein LSS_20291 [Leptospira santarosai serovar Shermani str. LT 821]EMO15230.1 hypothetical protein LEP1GSC165_1050 [Leptospira santarosai str. CBC523]EMP01786.1 hypothetical protein LEP1GSC171_0977 [Leptospira santarosai str. HAI1380]EPG82911.1 hypothetical protein LEP1GSC048_3168 [Leptospira santarosai serovar She